MDPASLFVGTAASCVVTELIKGVIKWTQAAVKCKSECKKLHEELVVIVPDVERIERRLAKLRELPNRAGDAHEDLQMVEDWLQRLKNAIEIAKVDVERCNSGRFSLDQHKLSARLTKQFGTITTLGHQRQSLFLLLRNLMHAPAQAEGVHPQQENWYESPGELALRKMADERIVALRREESTRLSMSSGSSSSGHGGWSFDYGGFDASGYGTDSPRAQLLRQGTQARDVTFFQRDEQQHAEAHFSRRHTMAAGTQELAKAFGHDPLPAHNRWKY